MERYRVDLPLLYLELEDMELEYSDNGLKWKSFHLKWSLQALSSEPAISDLNHDLRCLLSSSSDIMKADQGPTDASAVWAQPADAQLLSNGRQMPNQLSLLISWELL